jgi:p-cumate 2,3-dioxygenase beta subunit
MNNTATMSNPLQVTRQEIEDFLYADADLLDSFKLEEWLGQFLPNSHYLVPSLDVPTASGQDSLYLVMDDLPRLSSRVHQYLGRSMWVENPPARTRRMISNVRINATTDTQIHVSANFVVYRIRNEVVDAYIGRYEHILVPTAEGFRFLERKAVLDLEALRPFGKVSIIL